ncbi:MFS transporter [Alphaproteobacteria bacterium]|nr:MFS transporter [Alphaproteobacteria bacterium]
MDAAVAAARRDIKVISLIGVAHLLSHVYHLSLPALFPIIHEVEGIGYAELGVLASTFFVVSACSQAPAGFLIDRIGARPVLITGMILITGASTLFAFTYSYGGMIGLAIFAGLGNSVFHPANFSILNGSVSEKRIGRGLSIHGFGGYAGYAATPFCMYWLGSLIGWRDAMFVAGGTGLIVTAVMWGMRAELRDSVVDKGIKPQKFVQDLGVLFQPSAVLAFTFFALMAMGSIGLMTFGAVTLIALLELPADKASMIISLQLTGSMIGILLGGMLADRYPRHDLMTAIVVTLGVALLMTVPLLHLYSVYILVPIFFCYGVLYGIAGPLRDMVVRSIAPSGSAGKVFGFTYSGMDVGSAIATFLFGYMLSQNLPFWVFMLIGTFMMFGVFSILFAKMAADRSTSSVAA